MQLDIWAQRWNIPADALQELKKIFNLIPDATNENAQHSEAGVLSRVRLEAAKKGISLWRNNNGAGKMESGNFVRFGLANESARINNVIKSGDLIGIKPVLITKKLIGSIIGQFISREIKPSGWRFMNTDREKAQLAWAQFIVAQGGDACFASEEGTL